MIKEKSEKSLIIALILWFFIGGLALHHFYVGKTSTGILYIVSWLTIIVPVIWWFVDGIKLVTESFTDDENKVLKWEKK
jgi:TM2 domain-containing membrane protein YozV